MIVTLKNTSGSIRKGDWQLTEFFDDETPELYNLGEDPGESCNLASLYPDKLSELSAERSTWKGQVLK